LLAEDRADTLWLSGEGQTTIELRGKPYRGHARISKSARKLCVRNDSTVRMGKKNGLNGHVLFDGPGEVPNAFDEV
jgi:hypothetical protein